MGFKKTMRLTAAISVSLVSALSFGAMAAGAYSAALSENTTNNTSAEPGSTVILSDFDMISPKETADTDLEDIRRLSKEEVPADILKAIHFCSTEKWYVISDNEYQYIYYHSKEVTSQTVAK